MVVTLKIFLSCPIKRGKDREIKEAEPRTSLQKESLRPVSVGKPNSKEAQTLKTKDLKFNSKKPQIKDYALTRTERETKQREKVAFKILTSEKVKARSYRKDIPSAGVSDNTAPKRFNQGVNVFRVASKKKKEVKKEAKTGRGPSSHSDKHTDRDSSASASEGIEQTDSVHRLIEAKPTDKTVQNKSNSKRPRTDSVHRRIEAKPTDKTVQNKSKSKPPQTDSVHRRIEAKPTDKTVQNKPNSKPPQTVPKPSQSKLTAEQALSRKARNRKRRRARWRRNRKLAKSLAAKENTSKDSDAQPTEQNSVDDRGSSESRSVRKAQRDTLGRRKVSLSDLRKTAQRDSRKLTRRDSLHKPSQRDLHEPTRSNSVNARKSSKRSPVRKSAGRKTSEASLSRSASTHNEHESKLIREDLIPKHFHSEVAPYSGQTEQSEVAQQNVESHLVQRNFINECCQCRNVASTESKNHLTVNPTQTGQSEALPVLIPKPAKNDWDAKPAQSHVVLALALSHFRKPCETNLSKPVHSFSASGRTEVHPQSVLSQPTAARVPSKSAQIDQQLDTAQNHAQTQPGQIHLEPNPCQIHFTPRSCSGSAACCCCQDSSTSPIQYTI